PGLGTNTVVHCTRLCHVSSVAALLEGMVSGAVPDIFTNARHSDLLLLTGTNTTANHPVAATYFKQAARSGTRIVIIDPRRPQIADFATWYCPIPPGTAAPLYNPPMHLLIPNNLLHPDF